MVPWSPEGKVKPKGKVDPKIRRGRTATRAGGKVGKKLRASEPWKTIGQNYLEGQ
jgi:hypothetical protein